MAATQKETSDVLANPPVRVLIGVVGGFVAGAVFIALNAWFATTMGKSPLAPFMMIASIIQGPAALQTGTASVTIGMALHSVLSAVFGALFAGLTVPVRAPGPLLLGGLVFGGAIYVVNFLVLAPLVMQFKAFTTTSQPLELAVHLVFGAVLVLFLLRPREQV